MSIFSENLIRVRKEKHMSQEELSRKSGVTQQAISMIEAEKRSPTEYTMQQLADGLVVPLSELVVIPTTKKPTAVSDDGLKDEIITLIEQLPEDQLPQVRDYAAWLKSRHAE